MSPCPFCRCDQVYLAEVEDGMLTVACPSCSMSGPVSVDGDPDEAVRGWEILCSRMCSHCRKNLIRHFTGRIRELKAELEALKREAPPDRQSEGAGP